MSFSFHDDLLYHEPVSVGATAPPRPLRFVDTTLKTGKGIAVALRSATDKVDATRRALVGAGTAREACNDP